jgi:hypothetical protein
MTRLRKLVALFLLAWMPLQALAVPLLTWHCASHEVPAASQEESAAPCPSHAAAASDADLRDEPVDDRGSTAKGGDFCCSHFSAVPAALAVVGVERVPFDPPAVAVPAFSFLSRPLTQPPRA